MSYAWAGMWPYRGSFIPDFANAEFLSSQHRGRFAPWLLHLPRIADSVDSRFSNGLMFQAAYNLQP